MRINRDMLYYQHVIQKQHEDKVESDGDFDTHDKLATPLPESAAKTVKFASNTIVDDNSTQSHHDEPDVADKIIHLLQEQKDLNTKELESERQTHDLLTYELAEMTSMLKESTLRMRQSILKQNIQLDDIHKEATENMEAVNEQKKQVNNGISTLYSACPLNLIHHTFSTV